MRHAGHLAGVLFLLYVSETEMHFWKRSLAAVMSVCALGMASAAVRADNVVFSNFGPGDSFDTSNTFTLGAGQALAWQFTSSGSGKLTKVEAALRNELTSGQSNARLTI